MQNLQKFLLFLVLLTCAPLFSLADTLTAKIVSIHDGDTMTVQVPGETQKYKIRLLGVDTPEVEFFEETQGEAAIEARDYLRSLAPVGAKAVILFDANGMDKHNRILGRIYVDDIELNSEMLKAGWGYFYLIFPFDKKLAADYSAAARRAFEEGRGLFSERFRDTQAPYEFRMSVRNQEGRNLVGDLSTKKLFAPDQAQQVPFWSRVYFSSQELALRNGYKF